MKKLILLFLFLSSSYSTKVFAQQVRVSEIHYDDNGGDINEGIEVSGFAGVDLSGWEISLYRQDGTVYSTINLSGIIPDEGGSGFGAIWFPESGIQNGPTDGFALVDSDDNLIEFLSYEGTFMAIEGFANGMTSTDIGVSEPGTTTEGLSLQRTNLTTWTGPITASPGSINGSFDTGILPVNISMIKIEISFSLPLLSWTTTSEINNSHFEIEHSMDGRNFITVGKIEAQTARSQEKYYEFIHLDPTKGINYYRLKQVDLDGTETFFEILTIDLKQSKNRIYPTATQNSLYIHNDIIGERYTIINAAGTHIQTRTSIDRSIDVSTLSQGMYFIRFDNETHKFVKM